MERRAKIAVLLLRLSLGWLFFYAGFTKVINPDWSAAGYLAGAKTFTGFYHWLATPAVLPVINFLNEWGLTLLGVSLLAGLFVRWSALAGAGLMLLYYFALPFPYPNEHSFLIDEHIVYALALILLWTLHAGKYWGLDIPRKGRK